MRDLKRNKREIWYANYESENPVLDDFGNETSEAIPVYSAPAKLWINFSGASGEAAAEAFGAFTDYTLTMVIADPNCPIKESAAVWIGVPNTEPYNYIVTRVAKSLNGKMYALKEVSVS